MKWIVTIVAGVVGFLVAFGLTSSDEIAAEVERKLDEDFIPQCVKRAQFPPEFAGREEDICGCMKRDFDARGLKLTDAFGEQRDLMRQITQECAAAYR